MRVPDPDILVIQRPPLFREGRDLVHHVPACSEGARACWGRGGGSPFGPAPFLLGGGGVGAAKSLLPSFLVPKGNQPTACTLALWWLKFGPTEEMGGGGWGEMGACACACACAYVSPFAEGGGPPAPLVFSLSVRPNLCTHAPIVGL